MWTSPKVLKKIIFGWTINQSVVGNNKLYISYYYDLHIRNKMLNKNHENWNVKRQLNGLRLEKGYAKDGNSLIGLLEIKKKNYYPPLQYFQKKKHCFFKLQF